MQTIYIKITYCVLGSKQGLNNMSKFPSKLLQDPVNNWQKWFHFAMGPGLAVILVMLIIWLLLFGLLLRQLLPEFRTSTKMYLGDGKMVNWSAFG